MINLKSNSALLIENSRPGTGERKIARLLFLVLVILLAVGLFSEVQAAQSGIPSLKISLDGADEPAEVAGVIKLVFLMTIITLAPSILLMLTSFTRIIIVIHFLRQAMGVQQSPPNQVVVGLSLFLTFFIMAPVWEPINENALQPYMNNELSQEEALAEAAGPLRSFMLKNTRESDLKVFLSVSKVEAPENPETLPMRVVIPSFIISELKTAFQIGFMVYLPFLVLDMMIASILMSMGMMMLPPVLISLPFKLMLFVMVDGWALLVGSLTNSFMV